MPVDIRAATWHRRIHRSAKGESVGGSDTKQRRAPRDEVELMVVDVVGQCVDKPWDWVEYVRDAVRMRAEVPEKVPSSIQRGLDIVAEVDFEVYD